MIKGELEFYIKNNLITESQVEEIIELLIEAFPKLNRDPFADIERKFEIENFTESHKGEKSNGSSIKG